LSHYSQLFAKSSLLITEQPTSDQIVSALLVKRKDFEGLEVIEPIFHSTGLEGVMSGRDDQTYIVFVSTRVSKTFN